MPSFLISLFLAICLALPAQGAEWARNSVPTSLLASEQEPPPYPEGWWVERGIYAEVAGHPRERATIRKVLEHAERSIPDLAEQMGVASGRRLRIYLTHSADQFQRLQPDRPPAWADATAWPQRGLIFLRSPRIRPGNADPLLQVLDHEIVHAVLGQAFGPRPVPRWLQEGLAQVLSGEYSPAVTREIAQGVMGTGLSSLEDLSSGFPADPLGAKRAYAQSADFVAWLNKEGGQHAVRILVGELSKGAGLGAAVRKATGRSLDEVDADWRERWESSGVQWTALADEGIFWGVAAFGLAIGAFGVKRRNRRRLEEWARQEALRDALLQMTIQRWRETQEEPEDFVEAPIWTPPIVTGDEERS